MVAVKQFPLHIHQRSILDASNIATCNVSAVTSKLFDKSLSGAFGFWGSVSTYPTGATGTGPISCRGGLRPKEVRPVFPGNFYDRVFYRIELAPISDCTLIFSESCTSARKRYTDKCTLSNETLFAFAFKFKKPLHNVLTDVSGFLCGGQHLFTSHISPILSHGLSTGKGQTAITAHKKPQKGLKMVAVKQFPLHIHQRSILDASNIATCNVCAVTSKRFDKSFSRRVARLPESGILISVRYQMKRFLPSPLNSKSRFTTFWLT